MPFAFAVDTVYEAVNVYVIDNVCDLWVKFFELIKPVHNTIGS